MRMVPEVGDLESRQHHQAGGLAGARGTEQRQELALVHDQVQIPHDPGPPVIALADALEFNVDLSVRFHRRTYSVSSQSTCQPLGDATPDDGSPPPSGSIAAASIEGPCGAASQALRGLVAGTCLAFLGSGRPADAVLAAKLESRAGSRGKTYWEIPSPSSVVVYSPSRRAA